LAFFISLDSRVLESKEMTLLSDGKIYYRIEKVFCDREVNPNYEDFEEVVSNVVMGGL